jgi:hypothetical protein
MRALNRRLRSTLAVASLVAALLAAPHGARAQDANVDGGVTQTPNPIGADFKGIVGLGLIGTELGFVVPALAGARDPWPYIVFPILGAGAGGTAGYFLLEQGGGEPELAVVTLTVGLALVIPAMVVTLAATAYDPETDEPRARIPARIRALRDAGPGLVRFSDDGLMLAPPAIVARRSMSDREALRTGGRPSRELSVAVMSGRF